MPARRGITPWIEKLIGSYDREEGTRAGGLQAHVVDFSQMSPSQALGSEGPTGLLFLSDEQVQIPAVLTASAWDRLQEDEDLECFRSLLDHSVCIKDYRLCFHMSAEQTRSKFFLSVGKLETMAVVGIKKTNTPSCTSLQSVQTKICQTWRAMLGQQDSLKSESGFDLTDLLGEWQQDCLLTEREHVHNLLTVSPQPSTSTVNPTATLPDTCSCTSWDMDTVRYKGSESFVVPVHHLLVPGTSRQLNAQLHTGGESVGPSQILETSPVATQSQMFLSEASVKQQSATDDTVNVMEDAPVVLSGTSMSPLSNPWDRCPPPSNTSSTKSSPRTSPFPHSPIFAESATNLQPVYTSTQICAHSNGSQREILTEPSLFPPYQKPPVSAPPASSTSSRQSAIALSRKSESADPTSSTTTQETANKLLLQKCSSSLRKRGAPWPEDVIGSLEDKEEQVDSSPPSWMFDSTAEQSISQTQDPPVVQLTQVHPCVHSDGKAFSYTYQVKGQELQHFSRFTVKPGLVQWAVRYLLMPKHHEHHSTGITASQAEDNHVSIS